MSGMSNLWTIWNHKTIYETKSNFYLWKNYNIHFGTLILQLNTIQPVKLSFVSDKTLHWLNSHFSIWVIGLRLFPQLPNF